jgi:hypothetical protein
MMKVRNQPKLRRVLDGYEMLTLNLCKTDAGRGMILYIDSCVKYSPINIDIDFQEYICVEFSLKNKDKLLLASIYRSPSSTVVKELRSKRFCQLPVQVT